jgi:ubiquinone/menaquinone biosynthesis C-methylase UbiE
MATPYQSEDVQRFHRWSRTYERSWMQGLFFDRVHRVALDLAAPFPAPATILDVGCGTGRLLRSAAKRWPQAALIGVDPAEGMVEAARRLTPAATFYVGLGESIPLPDASVDLAFSTTSFHHWHNQAAGVREVARVLRPGGHFILVDFAAPSSLQWLFRHNPGAPAGRRTAYFTAAGLRVLELRPALSRFVLATTAAR